MIKTIQHWIEYIIVKSLIVVLNPLPLGISLRFGDILGFLAFSVLRVRRRVTLINLKNSFGDKYSDREYRKIGLMSYINFVRSMIEFGLYPKLKKIGLEKTVRMVNFEPLDEHLKTGKGAVLLSGHFGNLELIGVALTTKQWPVDFLVGKQHNKLINDLLNKHRAMFGVGIIEVGVSAKEVFRILKQGRWIAFLSDQDAGRDGTIVNFLGRPASTPKGAAAFALRYDCPIFVGALVREGLKKHVLYFEGPITIEKSGDKDKDIQRLTQAYTDVIGDYITQYPHQYFWMHKRWKTTCPDDYAKK
jgi:KDO2-lipid IV(A) lauroyltransferase